MPAGSPNGARVAAGVHLGLEGGAVDQLGADVLVDSLGVVVGRELP